MRLCICNLWFPERLENRRMANKICIYFTYKRVAHLCVMVWICVFFPTWLHGGNLFAFHYYSQEGVKIRLQELL